MRVLFVSAYPEEVFFSMINSGVTISQAAQRFNTLLIQGLCLNDIDVDVLYINDFNHCNRYNEYFTFYQKNQITYTNLRHINIRFLRRITSQIQIEIYVNNWCKMNKDGFLFVDILNQYAEQSIRIAHKHGVRVVAHITDLPYFMYDDSTKMGRARRKVAIKSFEKKLSMIDYYVLLTEAMNERIKAPKKNYIIMEGVVPAIPEEAVSLPVNANSPFVYTGIISRKYGLQNLVEAFMREELSGETLVLYGNGEYANEVKQLSKRYTNIVYNGCLTNEAVMQKQREAKCLINPRPTRDEYTRYSFPSKNIEYMLSGRPVITTKLPGIPEEYKEYCYFFVDDTVDGIVSTIVDICKLSDMELNEKGLRARAFVQKNKTNKMQIKRVLEMMGRKTNC